MSIFSPMNLENLTKLLMLCQGKFISKISTLGAVYPFFQSFFFFVLLIENNNNADMRPLQREVKRTNNQHLTFKISMAYCTTKTNFKYQISTKKLFCRNFMKNHLGGHVEVAKP